MRSLFVALLVLAAGIAPAAAQTAVTGVVTDSTGTTLPGATIALLQRADSSIVGFTTTRADGAFAMPRVARGAYLVQVSFVGFTPVSQPFDVADEAVDLGRIVIEPVTEALGSLVVTADRVPVVVRRDTLDFDAGAFATPPGSSVEDLLRRLPGVEVERDGSVRAQGEKVERVLVDGREFFGDDPTLATRNLPADAVDRVQVYDGDSETSAFTGVADGQEQRTINLKLKPDRRTGQFGSVHGGGGGSPGSSGGARFDGKASVNRFGPSTQLSVLADANNIGRQAFGLDDVISFLGGLSALSGGGVLRVPEGLPIGDDASDGFATTASGGVNLGRDLGRATRLDLNTFSSQIWTERDRDTRRFDLLGADQRTETQEATDQTGRTDAHRLNLSLLHTVADGHDLRLRSSLRTIGTALDASSLRRTTGPTGVLEDDLATRRETDARTIGGDAGLTYRRRLGTRSVIATVDGSADWKRDDRDLSTDPTDLDALGRIDQTQRDDDRTAEVGAELLLTQSLGPRRAVQLRLEHDAVADRLGRTILDRAVGALPLDLGLDRTAQVSRAGLTVRNNGPSYTSSAGLTVQRTGLAGAVTDLGQASRRRVRLLPSAAFTLSLAQSRQVSLRYRASSSEPALRSLQPGEDVRGPLDVFRGNPTLTPETQHTASARYVHFDAFSLSTVTASLASTLTINAISTAQTVDVALRRTRTPINAGTAWQLRGDAGYDTPIRRLRTAVSLSGSVTHDRKTERLDGLDNDAAVTRATLDVSAGNQRKVWLDVRAGARLAWTDARYSLSPAFDRRYLSRAVYAEASAQIGGAWLASTSFDHEVFPSGVFGTSQRLPRWHAEVSRAVSARTRIELSARDLLDQGLDVRYDAAPTVVQEERVRSLGRHLMLRLTVDLSPVRR